VCARVYVSGTCKCCLEAAHSDTFARRGLTDQLVSSPITRRSTTTLGLYSLVSDRDLLAREQRDINGQHELPDNLATQIWTDK